MCNLFYRIGSSALSQTTQRRGIVRKTIKKFQPHCKSFLQFFRTFSQNCSVYDVMALTRLLQPCWKSLDKIWSRGYETQVCFFRGFDNLIDFYLKICFRAIKVTTIKTKVEGKR